MSADGVENMLSEWANYNGIALNISELEIDGEFLMLLKPAYLQDILGFENIEDGVSLYKYIHAAESKLSSKSMIQNGDNLKHLRRQILDQGLLFSAPYKDPTNMVDSFISYANGCFDHYQANSATFNSPYFCLVQSSGYGKTRLLREVARKVRVLYVCMRSEKSSTGYPRRSDTAIKALFDGLHEQSVSKYVEELSARLAKCFQSALTKLPSPGVNDDLSKALFPSEQLAEIVWNLNDVKVSTEIGRSTELVVLVLDEARATLNKSVEGISQFRLIRRALAKFALSRKKWRFVTVFVDTSSRIGKFSPSADKDPSLRFSSMDAEMIAPRLYMPFIVRHSFDVNLKPHQGSDLSSLVGSYEYLGAGRPLVSIPSVGALSEGRPADLSQLSFLQRKLHGGQSQRTREGALSEMLCRLGAFVHPQHPYATELVADFMATLLAMDNEQNSMLVAYVAEPKLAIAAAQAWNSETYFVNEMIPALQYALITGAVSQGSRGELVSQIVWLLAFDRAAQVAGKSVGECIELKQVLTQLIPEGQTIDVSLVIPLHLHEAQTACCQIVNVVSKFNSRLHVQAAERHCGVSFCDGQTGVDLGFPLFTENLAIVLSQTKNRADMQYPCSSIQAACFKMQPKVAFAEDNLNPEEVMTFQENCVRVFMQVGGKTARAVIESDLSPLAPTLQIFGLGSRCLSPGVRKCLQVLVDGSLNLQNFAKYQYMTRDPSVPFPDSDPITSVAAWPFIHDAKSVTAEDVDSSEESFDLKAIKDYDERSEIFSAAINVKVDRLRQICIFHGLKTSGSKADLLNRIFNEIGPTGN